LLLDTHALLWVTLGDPRLSPKVVKALDLAETEVFVSAASYWEMAIKTSIGKLELGMDLPNIAAMVAQTGVQELPVLGRHTHALVGLPWHHKDPFDRILVAQALSEGLTLVSCDQAFQAYKVPLFW